jgi:hypothetical protein
MFRFKPTNQFAYRFRSVVSCALKLKDLISNSFFFFVNSTSNKKISNVFQCTDTENYAVT